MRFCLGCFCLGVSPCLGISSDIWKGTSIFKPDSPNRKIELKIRNSKNSNSTDIDLKSTAEIVQVFHEEDQKAVAAVKAESDAIAHAIDLCVDAFRAGGRLFYVGAGTSGRLGVLDASECPPTFSTPPEMVQGIIAGGDVALRRSIEGEEDKPERGAHAIRERQLTPQDILVGIASSGRTPYVIGALKEAHTIGATTMFLCCVPPPVHLKKMGDAFHHTDCRTGDYYGFNPIKSRDSHETGPKHAYNRFYDKTRQGLQQSDGGCTRL